MSKGRFNVPAILDVISDAERIKRLRDKRTFTIDEESMVKLERIRKRSGHVEKLATLEWLIRAMYEKFERMDGKE